MKTLTLPSHDVAHEEAVDRGVDFLDEKLGRDVWLPRIDLRTLNVGSVTDCVLCQATGIRSFGDALESVGVDVCSLLRHGVRAQGAWTEHYGFGLTRRQRGAYGFGFDDRDWPGLNAAWERRVRVLRGESA